MTVPEPAEGGHAGQAHVLLAAAEATQEQEAILVLVGPGLLGRGPVAEKRPSSDIALLTRRPAEPSDEEPEHEDHPTPAYERTDERQAPPTIHRLFVGGGYG